MIRGSNFFNGGAYLNFAGSSSMAIATSTTPFTFETWVYLRVAPTSATAGVLFTERYTGAGNSISLIVKLCDGTSVNGQGSTVGFGWYNGTSYTTAATATESLLLYNWTHVVCVFTGSTSRIYLNGLDKTKASSPTPAATWGITQVNGDGWRIGGDVGYFNGFLYNLRFVNGNAVYTANFTPTTGTLSTEANASIYTCNNYNAILDSSSNNVALTNVNVERSLITPDRSNYTVSNGGGWIGESTISSEDYNWSVSEENSRGRWSSLPMRPFN